MRRLLPTAFSLALVLLGAALPSLPASAQKVVRGETPYATRADLQRDRQRYTLADRQHDVGVLRRLESLQLHRHFVVAGIEQRRLEVAGSVGDEALADLRVDVRDLHGGAGDHRLIVTNRTGDVSASFLRACRQGQQDRQEESRPRSSHAVLLPWVGACVSPVALRPARS